MVDARKLEKALLQVVAKVNSDDWVKFSLTDLQNKIVEFDKALGRPSPRETVDTVCALARIRDIRVQKWTGNSFAPLDTGRWEDTNYQGTFFGIGRFQIMLTHEGRKAISHEEVNVEDSIVDEDVLDDRLPFYRAKVFDADLPKRAQESERTKQPLCLVMVDLDHFKAVNDTYNHPTGNEVLLGVSKIIADRVGEKGKAYRFGGDEFTLLLPNYTAEEGIALAETIRKQIEQSVFSAKNLKMTASFGLAVFPEHARNATELLKSADEALYDAKKLGRNRVRVFGDPIIEGPN